ncbi:hypothetical protein D3C81_503630 [compost metagenome]
MLRQEEWIFYVGGGGQNYRIPKSKKPARRLVSLNSGARTQNQTGCIITLIYLHFIVFYKCRGPHMGPLMRFDHFLVKRDAAALQFCVVTFRVTESYRASILYHKA